MVDVGLKGNLEIKSITIYRAIASTFQFKKIVFCQPAEATKGIRPICFYLNTYSSYKQNEHFIGINRKNLNLVQSGY